MSLRWVWYSSADFARSLIDSSKSTSKTYQFFGSLLVSK